MNPERYAIGFEIGGDFSKAGTATRRLSVKSLFMEVFSYIEEFLSEYVSRKFGREARMYAYLGFEGLEKNIGDGKVDPDVEGAVGLHDTKFANDLKTFQNSSEKFVVENAGNTVVFIMEVPAKEEK